MLTANDFPAFPLHIYPHSEITLWEVLAVVMAPDSTLKCVIYIGNSTRVL